MEKSLRMENQKRKKVTGKKKKKEEKKKKTGPKKKERVPFCQERKKLSLCMSIRCLAPQPSSRFFPFLPWFSFAFGNFAHYCVVLLNAL